MSLLFKSDEIMHQYLRFAAMLLEHKFKPATEAWLTVLFPNARIETVGEPGLPTNTLRLSIAPLMRHGQQAAGTNFDRESYRLAYFKSISLLTLAHHMTQFEKFQMRGEDGEMTGVKFELEIIDP